MEYGLSLSFWQNWKNAQKVVRFCLTVHKDLCIFSHMSKREKLLMKLMAGNQDLAFTFE